MGAAPEKALFDLSPAEEEEANKFAMQLTSFSVLPMILKSAIELDLLEIIAKAGPGAYLSAKEIASQLPATNPDAGMMLDRMLRFLACYSVVKCSVRNGGEGKVERVYGLAPVCKFLVKNEDGVAISALALMNQDTVLMESWYHLNDAVLDGGIPFNKAYGMTAFDYHGTDPRFNKVFNKGMADHSTITMKKILETYDGFNGLTSVVDVGGGTGAVLNMIVSKCPNIKGINFDLPHVVQDAPSYPDHGKVIVAKCILPEMPDESLGTKAVNHIDVIMLAHNPGGKERTEGEFKTLAKSAGFPGFRVACCAYNTYIMEFLKSC
ncbi:hypothetical protein QQ045_000814 [Rhodiola kirilowii]